MIEAYFWIGLLLATVELFYPQLLRSKARYDALRETMDEIGDEHGQRMLYAALTFSFIFMALFWPIAIARRFYRLFTGKK